MATIDVCITAWPNNPQRCHYLWQVLESHRHNLRAFCDDIVFYCSMETERDPRHKWCGDQASKLMDDYGVTWQWRQAPANLGANTNRVMRMGDGEYVFLLQDDWTLDSYLDLSAGTRVLEAHKEVDIVRYCWPDTDAMRPAFDGFVAGFRRIDVSKGGWVYGDDPHMRRRDFMDKWGWYLEGGGHASASSTLMRKLIAGNTITLVADKVYYRNIGYASAVLNDTRESAGRRYE